MAIELIAKIKPKNNGSFPMADAVDVEMPDGLRVPEAVAKKLDNSGWSANKLLVTDNDGAVVETDIPEIPEAGLPESGWAPNKYLGTDSDGNVVEKDAPTGGGLTEVSWEDIQNKPFYDESVTSQVSFDPLPMVTFDGAGYTWWKCSDLVLTREQILKATILTTFAPGTQFAEVPKETDIVVDEENFTGVLFASGSNAGYIFCRATGEHTVSFAGNPVTFVCPEVGVYMGYPMGQTPPTTISVGIGYKDVKTLDAKYLPAEAVPVTIDLSGYKSNGKIIETFADGSTETTTMTFDSEGRPSTITDKNGNVTTLTW